MVSLRESSCKLFWLALISVDLETLKIRDNLKHDTTFGSVNIPFYYHDNGFSLIILHVCAVIINVNLIQRIYRTITRGN
jgi:hypothetical protein